MNYRIEHVMYLKQQLTLRSSHILWPRMLFIADKWRECIRKHCSSKQQTINSIPKLLALLYIHKRPQCQQLCSCTIMTPLSTHCLSHKSTFWSILFQCVCFVCSPLDGTLDSRYSYVCAKAQAVRYMVRWPVYAYVHAFKMKASMLCECFFDPNLCNV